MQGATKLWAHGDLSEKNGEGKMDWRLGSSIQSRASWVTDGVSVSRDLSSEVNEENLKLKQKLKLLRNIHHC